MEPEQRSPYWELIVGDQWPAIAPTQWRSLGEIVRDGAATVDSHTVDQARQAFDERVRSSAGIQSIKDEMLDLRGHPNAFSEALLAVADAAEEFAALVDRARNRILDIVGEATARIADTLAAAEPGENSGEEATPISAIARVIAGARAEVADVVGSALLAVRPILLPTLQEITGANRPHTPELPSSDPRQESGQTPSIQHVRAGTVAPDTLAHATTPPMRSESDEPEGLGAEPSAGVQENAMAIAPPADRPVSGSSADAGRVHDDLSSVSVVEDEGTGRNTGVETVSPARGPRVSTSEAEVGSPGRRVYGEIPDVADGVHDQSRADPEHITTVEEVRSEPKAGLALPPLYPIMPPHTAAPIAVDTTATSSGVKPSSPARALGGAAESKSSMPNPKGHAVRSDFTGDRSTAARGPQLKPAVAHHNPPAAGIPVPRRDNDDSIAQAVGTAMAAAAAPAFVLGDRVDADLVLAKTLLAGVLAAANPVAPSLRWALSVQRYSEGLRVFVTSNEGRGWIPAGVYLPRGVSTPWIWQATDDAWEGVADPARVLAEFAVVSAGRSGARLSALVSSTSIDPQLRRQLGDTAVEGAIRAAADGGFGSPGPERVDRLQIAGSNSLAESADSVPEEQVAARCLDLAADAHRRMRNAPSAAALGLPQRRERILRAKNHAEEIPSEWWNDLRDLDDVLAASMMVHQQDVSRIALGQLRSEPEEATQSGAATLRWLAFERRCDELVLQLLKSPTRQVLRDAVYAHAQVLTHPLFAHTVMSTKASAAVARTPLRGATTGPMIDKPP